MKRRIHVATLVAIALCGARAWTDDIFPPDWRSDPPGQGFTTFQAWEFGTDANPVAPDQDYNSFGDPFVTVIGDAPFATWVVEHQDHVGLWRFEDWMEVYLPNSPEPRDFKHVWLQLTYSAENGSDPEILSLPGFSSIELVNKVQLDDYYWHATWQITIEPNPDEELVVIMPRDCTLYVDELVVDTICIPEAASLTLLAAMGLLLRRR